MQRACNPPRGALLYGAFLQPDEKIREVTMSIRTLLLLIACVLGVATVRTLSTAPANRQAGGSCPDVNVLTPIEQSGGWLLLFDGKSTAGWHGYNKQDTKAWVIEDCSLKTSGTKGNYGSDKRADLVTDREFTNFELSFDWKATSGGNSGVMYGVIEDPKYQTAWMTGPEYQLMDDVGVKEDVEPAQKAGSDYAMHPPDDKNKMLKSVGEWNTTRIVVNGAHVEHWLNGKKIVEFERWTPEWRALRDAGK